MDPGRRIGSSGTDVNCIIDYTRQPIKEDVMLHGTGNLHAYDDDDYDDDDFEDDDEDFEDDDEDFDEDFEMKTGTIDGR